ncbi:MAG: neutral/alkaline non-lysosomal ceramidase N-terminal domain-containing protein [Lentisphaeria bacterium]|nr:neutral/alkaline non-lysosomal ceramidase N-terminal domain-containing protein [Lentisphaeria bacterium]
MAILVGHGRCDITPLLGIGMVGYASRKEGATGVHDELFVQAVVLDDGAAPVALVAYDLCLLTPALATEFKEAIRQATGLAPEQVFLNTSHTHAGPTLGGYGDVTEQVLAYRAVVIDQTIAAIRAARADCVPATFHVGHAPLDIGCNRRETLSGGRVILGHDPNGPTVHRVTVWLFSRQDRPDLAIFSTPMHGTTLGGQNRILSAEWMGMAVQYFERDYPNLRAIFLQGCGANQDPYYTRVEGGRGTFAELEEHGRQAAIAIAQAVVAVHPLDPSPMRPVLRRLELAPKEAGGEPQTLILHGLRLGEAMLLTLNAETFVEFAQHGVAISPAAETLILGYTDGNIGYLCTANAHREGGYEAGTTRVAPESEDIVKAAMGELFAELQA